MISNSLMHLDKELASIAVKLRQQTVIVRSNAYSVGSGVIWDQQGLIVTNAHVATKEHLFVELWDGRRLKALRTSINPALDLASLRVQATDLPAATIFDSDKVRVGEVVLAVGNPLGFEGSLTMGILHAKNTDTLMADVRLFPGNSGGPLADSQGRVIGINTMITGSSLGLASSTERVKSFLHGELSALGVTLKPIRLRSFFRPLGLQILSVEPKTPAMTAGLKIGDIIIAAGEKPLYRFEDLAFNLFLLSFGDVLSLEVLRGGQRLNLKVILSWNQRQNQKIA